MVRVVKIPLGKDRKVGLPVFQKFDTDLFLGLIENPKKIRPGCPLIPMPKITMDMRQSPVKPPIPIIVPSTKSPVKIPEKNQETLKPKLEEDVEKDEYEEEGDEVEDEAGEFYDDESEDEVLKVIGKDAPNVEAQPAKEKTEPPKETDIKKSPPKQPLPQPPKQIMPPDPYAGLSPEEKEMKQKREYMLKFDMLRRGLKEDDDIKIPDYTEHSDIRAMRQHYDYTIKSMTMKQNLSSYRSYMMGGFAFVEYISTQYIGIDMSKFAKRQTDQIQAYDHLLIELGERSYSQWSTSLPVEVRIMCLILFNAAIFYLGKIGILGDVMNIISNPGNKSKKKKMKGPKSSY